MEGGCTLTIFNHLILIVKASAYSLIDLYFLFFNVLINNNHTYSRMYQTSHTLGFYHSIPPIIYTANAASHATTHCQITTITAQRCPISLLMEAMAAIQGE